MTDTVAVFGTNPRTGAKLPPVAVETTGAEVAALVTAAAASAPGLAGLDRAARAHVLDAVADGIEDHRDELIEIASAETGFTTAKLAGELTRAAFQFRFFGDVVREGSYLEAAIDPAAETPMGPRPDLRRILTAIGPVAVFGSSNFPFAFSVLGGDTASALAAGCPVVLKAHPSHPATSQRSFEVLATAVPDGAVAIVHGTQAGIALVAQPAIKAVGFTGSLRGGRALLDVVNARDEPIPFYGELSSLNPVVVTPAAAAERAEDIGAGLVGSFTLGSGQLCTKPGFVLVPDSAEGDRLVAAVRAGVVQSSDHVLLNEGIHAAYAAETAALRGRADVRTTTGPGGDGAGFAVAPMVVETALAELDPHLVHEVFGPVTVIVRYPAGAVIDSATTALESLPPSLTATVHHSESDDALTALTALASARAGRVVFNAFPTGVAVSWAQHHGGPWPSTNALHTSVGATAIRRFLRPVTYQNAPAHVLPAELRDGYDRIPRRIDGVLHPAG
ncbi:aldehyde dehydrogenase [Mycolicibacterium madagascariense]|uniref:Aldehyde dehydrogenase n=1 Tax=Mycolicibacterium madagascariense TaxID=212765 RepID=A0A7I7XD01_9MYCO|nr:aldehyde dehydrogenase (NADP(+)) [Mycolicibacterium madagascariense]MCV7015203.1 aldehyde dehydrogenase (NADP(+)) [Mycolicibacterium madagascariense]BBZ27496.1 aldehyde dehydrogenase [Mycolicibacterium madagascariense]